MDRRRFLKTAAGLFIPAAPAIIRPASAQMWPFPGPGRAAPGGGGGNAFTLIASGSGVGDPNATTSAIDTTGADLLIVAFSYYNAGGAVATMSDSKSNTWTALTNRPGGFATTRIYYCRGGTVGSGHTFTLTGNGGGQAAIGMMAWSGSNATPFDVQNGGTSTGSTSVQPGSVTPSQNNSLIVASHSALNGTSLGIDSGFTMQVNINKGGSNYPLSFSYLKQNTAAAVNPTISWTTAADATAAIAVFKP